jgi:Ca2+-binding RTX toxin-like protein
VQVNLATGTGAGGDAEGDLLVNIQNVVGSNFGDVLVGDGNNNTINGAGSADVLSGGGGNDIFAFTPGSGQDVITDFTPHVGGGGNSNADVISLSGYGQFGVVDFASAQTHFSQVGSDVVISLSATDAITLKNVTLAQLHDADFLFG